MKIKVMFHSNAAVCTGLHSTSSGCCHLSKNLTGLNGGNIVTVTKGKITDRKIHNFANFCETQFNY